MPARGLHGEPYRGHVFGDELFVFPFLNLRMPEITRALLRYRYRRLDEARATARAAGYRGAMFPWRSGSDGQEETPEVFLNQVSGNVEFLAEYGAEMVLEIAQRPRSSR